jgi:hypothetical protein
LKFVLTLIEDSGILSPREYRTRSNNFDHFCHFYQTQQGTEILVSQFSCLLTLLQSFASSEVDHLIYRPVALSVVPPPFQNELCDICIQCNCFIFSLVRRIPNDWVCGHSIESTTGTERGQGRADEPAQKYGFTDWNDCGTSCGVSNFQSSRRKFQQKRAFQKTTELVPEKLFVVSVFLCNRF